MAKVQLLNEDAKFHTQAVKSDNSHFGSSYDENAGFGMSDNRSISSYDTQIFNKIGNERYYEQAWNIHQQIDSSSKLSYFLITIQAEKLYKKSTSKLIFLTDWIKNSLIEKR